MKRNSKVVLVALILFVGLVLKANITILADVSAKYPGHPGTWDGLTTNTTIEIALDTPVAMVDPLTPDIEYCVKEATFNGLDFVFTDVVCAVEVSADRKTITFYPTDVLAENGLYAYKIININFEGGGSQQDVAAYFQTGDNPIPLFATQVNEGVPPTPPYETNLDMCSDEGGNLLTNKINFWCIRCHTDYVIDYPTVYGVCTIVP